MKGKTKRKSHPISRRNRASPFTASGFGTRSGSQALTACRGVGNWIRHERAKALAKAISGEALPYDRLNDFCPEKGMILANPARPKPLTAVIKFCAHLFMFHGYTRSANLINSCQNSVQEFLLQIFQSVFTGAVIIGVADASVVLSSV
nr:bifunctional 3-dehydroquinate dehydratase/shikimate dehydrogenase, chloroplastic-like [Ipomoea batatas]